MTDEERALLRAILVRQRESHQRLFVLQGTAIEMLQATHDALGETIRAVQRTQDEMAKVFLADNQAEDVIEGEGGP